MATWQWGAWEGGWHICQAHLDPRTPDKTGNRRQLATSNLWGLHAILSSTTRRHSKPNQMLYQERCVRLFFPLLLSPSQAQSLLQTQLQVYDTLEMGFWGEVSECKNWKLTWNLFLWARDSKIWRFHIIFLMGRTDTLLLLPRTKQVLIAQVGTRTPTWSTHSQSFLLGLWSHLSVDFLFCVCGLQGRGGSEQSQAGVSIWSLGQASNPFLSNWIDSESRDLHFTPSFATHQLHDLDLSSLGLEPKCAWASP